MSLGWNYGAPKIEMNDCVDAFNDMLNDNSEIKISLPRDGNAIFYIHSNGSKSINIKYDTSMRDDIRKVFSLQQDIGFGLVLDKNDTDIISELKDVFKEYNRLDDIYTLYGFEK